MSCVLTVKQVLREQVWYMSIEWLFPVKVNGLRIQMAMLSRSKRSVRECVRFLFYDITDQLCLFEIRLKIFCIIFLPITLSVVVASKICPPQCFCYEASVLVNCRSQGFTHIPHSIPHGTWLLDLSGNKLSELRSTSFTGIWALRVLLISQSSMQMVHSQTLASLNFLEKLDLSYNELRVLLSDFSEGLTSLKDLRLCHNALEHLDTHSLEDLESLEKLDLSHNNIDVIGVGAFHGLTMLKHLNLAWNQLIVLQGGLLTMQQGLGVLLLGHNNISKIEAEALAPLQTLTILNLEANQLRSFKFKTFLNLKTTSTHLQLSENPWMCDCELHRVFSKILQVRHLHVDDYWSITCHAPHLLAGAFLGLTESQLCIAETATVLVITGTVMVTVVAAIIMAEQQRKKKTMNPEK